MNDEYGRAMMEDMSNGGNQQQTSAGDSLREQNESPAEEQNETPEQENKEGEEASLFLTPDMLPPGMKVNSGDVLEFRVVNPSDGDGHIEVVYNTGKETGEATKPWEQELRETMSPTSDQGDGAQ